MASTDQSEGAQKASEADDGHSSDGRVRATTCKNIRISLHHLPGGEHFVHKKNWCSSKDFSTYLSNHHCSGLRGLTSNNTIMPKLAGPQAAFMSLKEDETYEVFQFSAPGGKVLSFQFENDAGVLKTVQEVLYNNDELRAYFKTYPARGAFEVNPDGSSTDTYARLFDDFIAGKLYRVQVASGFVVK